MLAIELESSVKPTKQEHEMRIALLALDPRMQLAAQMAEVCPIIQQQGETPLSMREYTVLLAVSVAETISVTDLVDLLGLRYDMIPGALDMLEARLLVEQKDVQTYMITGKGKRYTLKAKNLAEKAEQHQSLLDRKELLSLRLEKARMERQSLKIKALDAALAVLKAYQAKGGDK